MIKPSHVIGSVFGFCLLHVLAKQSRSIKPKAVSATPMHYLHNLLLGIPSFKGVSISTDSNYASEYNIGLALRSEKTRTLFQGYYIFLEQLADKCVKITLSCMHANPTTVIRRCKSTSDAESIHRLVKRMFGEAVAHLEKQGVRE